MSLKELFAAMTAAAVFCWCAASAGFANGPFWIITAVSVAMSAVWLGMARRPTARWLAALAPAPFLFCCGLLFASIALLQHALLLFVAGIVCAILPRATTRTLVAVAVVCMLTAYVGAVVAGKSRVLELTAMRQEFPIVPLGDRLDYERIATDASALPIKLAAHVDAELSDVELNVAYTFRASQLRRIHTREYENFVRAAGFGIERMGPPSRRRIRRPPLVDLAFDGEEPDQDFVGYYDWDWWRYEKAPDDSTELHLTSRDDFLHPDGFGAVFETRKTVVGFIPHGFHRPLTGKRQERPTWTVERLELVSLLKFDEPRVYVLDHLPRMDQLTGDDVPTRPLDEFESAALQRLRTAEDVVIDESLKPTRMLGSLRAANQCRDCHSVQRGELLGAFTYFLHPGGSAESLSQSAPGQ